MRLVLGLLLCWLTAVLATLATQHDLPAAIAAPAVDPGSRLYERMADLVVPHGYPLEEHFVKTVDGYILRLFRIPHGRFGNSAAQHHMWAQQKQHNQKHHSRRLSWLWRKPAELRQQKQQHNDALRPVVHLQHGLLDSSTGWVLNGPGFSLPFLLADAGYDVWLGNVRGNVFSRNHTTYNILDPRFWAFSWDEMADRDIPAMLTHELMTTGANDVVYVGHSQGTTIGMAFLSSHAGSALAERVQVAILLAPVAFVTHMDSTPLLTLAQLNTAQIFVLLGIHEFMPSIELMSKLEGQLCKLQPDLCVNFLAAICGYNPTNLDTSRLPTYVNYTPSGTSVQNMAHWVQQVRAPGEGVMRKFDYGTTCRTLLDMPRECNQAIYGQLLPPAYNLSAISNKLVLFTGGEDRLSDPKDLELLLKVLPKDKMLLHQHYPDYEHLDFLWGINAASWVYRKVLGIMNDLHGHQARP